MTRGSVVAGVVVVALAAAAYAIAVGLRDRQSGPNEYMRVQDARHSCEASVPRGSSRTSSEKAEV